MKNVSSILVTILVSFVVLMSLIVFTAYVPSIGLSVRELTQSSLMQMELDERTAAIANCHMTDLTGVGD
jgi:hypothetical protein